MCCAGLAFDFWLSRGNRELAKDGIFTWSIPALSAQTSQGFIATCPNAGPCAALCYARSGTYNFRNVKAAHRRNLERFLADPIEWTERMAQELKHRRYRPTGSPNQNWLWPIREDFTAWRDQGWRSVRIHDAGDFFNNVYLQAWIAVANKTPDVLFYAYTKEVKLCKAASLPANFVIIYSMGGKQDHLLDLSVDRHADVFPTLKAMERAGYTDQADCDLLAPLLPTNRIGIVRNNIRHLVVRQGNQSFSQLAA